MSDLRETVVRWQRGWTVARSLPPAEAVDGGLRSDCRQPTRDVEYLALDTDPATLAGLAGRVAAERAVTWLTVPATDPGAATAALETAGLVLLQKSEAMMAIDLRDHPRPEAAAGYRVETVRSGAVVKSTVVHESGQVAAWGTAGLSGTDAVADRIETHAAHRRRGLASTVMGSLAAAAVAAGAETGLLIASTDGQMLYPRLGWRTVARVLVATTPG
ncbi:N-acetyltransferase [Actinoplanes flavus]|uniref:N-acetyltransferase n=1 Tax=Actinoplanes flavus TaxID=2820290 RepID=A0ABS3US52_9ACTN|nr:N-acetyltransferase [Actinoplanes flavus]MBO3741406.1 N-acetyltransferase [Actinoplanes flavus]